MDKTRLRPLFDWGRCQACMMVSEGWDAMAPASAICPHCGESRYGAEWPPEPTRTLLRQAFLRPTDDREQTAVQALLVTTALDTLVGWVLRAAVDYLSTESLEIARLVDPVRKPDASADRRLETLEAVTGLRLNDVASAQDEPELPRRWQELREQRDRFLHAEETTALDDSREEELAEIARMAVKVMAHFNNLVF